MQRREEAGAWPSRRYSSPCWWRCRPRRPAGAAVVRRRRPTAAEESEGDAATAIQSVYRGHASRRRERSRRRRTAARLRQPEHGPARGDRQKWPRAGHIVTLTHGHFVANPGGKGANEAVALAAWD